MGFTTFQLNQFIARWVKDYRKEPAGNIHIRQGEASTVKVDLPFARITRACRTNLVEENLEPYFACGQGLKVAVGPYSITTVRVCP